MYIFHFEIMLNVVLWHCFSWASQKITITTLFGKSPLPAVHKWQHFITWFYDLHMPKKLQSSLFSFLVSAPSNEFHCFATSSPHHCVAGILKIEAHTLHIFSNIIGLLLAFCISSVLWGQIEDLLTTVLDWLCTTWPYYGSQASLNNWDYATPLLISHMVKLS